MMVKNSEKRETDLISMGIVNRTWKIFPEEKPLEKAEEIEKKLKELADQH